jgi:hypothetical protein
MQTCCFSRLALVRAASLEPVAISRGVPAWYAGRRCLALAPARSMLKAPEAEFDRYYDELLRALGPAQIAAELGENVALLCWERPGEPCHRRSVAEWLEYHLSVVVPELGEARAVTGTQSNAAYHFHRPAQAVPKQGLLF